MKTSSPPTDARKARPRRSLFARVLALVTLFLFGAASLMLADSLRGREDTAARVTAQHTGTRPPPRPPVEIDERMYAYLPPEIDFGPVRETRFAADRALYTAGPSHVAPQTTFERILRTLNPDGGVEAQRAALAAPPSAQGVLRTQASVGMIEGVAFLVRLPADVESTRNGHLRTEPGGIVLAYGRRHDSWEYLTFFFPNGLDLDGYVAQFGRPAGALEPLGPEVEQLLQPTVALGGGAMGGDALGLSAPSGRRPPTTVICQAVGETGVALDRAVASLQRRGWTALPGVEGSGREDTRVLNGPGGQVWFTTADRLQRDGMVTVMMDLP